MSVVSFSESLGVDEKAAPSAFATETLLVLGEGSAPVQQLSGYFAEWCSARSGTLAEGEYANRFHSATGEACVQAQEQRAECSWQGFELCTDMQGSPLGGYFTFRDNDGTGYAAFYTPSQLPSFTEKLATAAAARKIRHDTELAQLEAKVVDEKAREAAEAKRIQDEEDAIVQASGVGGTSVRETLQILDRIRLDDVTAMGTGFGYEAPCSLVVAHEKMPLENVRVSMRDAKQTKVTNATTHESETFMVSVVEVTDGTRHGAIEFASPTNAEHFAAGVVHLAQLCGAH